MTNDRLAELRALSQASQGMPSAAIPELFEHIDKLTEERDRLMGAIHGLSTKVSVLGYRMGKLKRPCRICKEDHDTWECKVLR